MALKRAPIANQVFVGCPWKTVKKKYEEAIEGLNNRFPLSFVLVGREDDQDALDLLGVIKDKLFSSSYAIFDATGGNANVSLEYGMAEISAIPKALYLSTNKKSQLLGKERIIISDLAGKRHVAYKTQRKLNSLLSQFSNNHAYTKRFNNFLRENGRNLTGGKKKSFRTLSLKIVHAIDDQEYIRRADAVLNLQGDGYKESDIQSLITKLHRAHLVRSGQGPAATLAIR